MTISHIPLYHLKPYVMESALVGDTAIASLEVLAGIGGGGEPHLPSRQRLVQARGPVPSFGMLHVEGVMKNLLSPAIEGEREPGGSNPVLPTVCLVVTEILTILIDLPLVGSIVAGVDFF